MVPSTRAVASSGAVSAARRPWAGASPMMNGVARGLTRLGPIDVLPSGVVIATPTIATTAIATAASSSWRPLNGPIRPWRSRLWVKPGRVSATDGSDGREECEVLRHQRQPVEDHRDADQHDEQAPDQGHHAAVAHERADKTGGAVVDERDRDERQP